ncbi:MAG TPA: hypothetical protein VMM17_03685 [Gemmatimonadaceae bacterium]|nr:hypothetical protein [Gemmatimonadaceae bacterium]
MIRRSVAGVLSAVVLYGCASSPQVSVATSEPPILAQSSVTSHWPVEGETRPGLWIRIEPYGAPVAVRELIDSLRITVEHGSRSQVVTGAAFSPVEGAGDSHQTRYLYTPTSGMLFVTLQLRTAGRWFFPDTQRIELNDDCWHWLSYRVRGSMQPAHSVPPPYPRTVFLTPALSADPPLFLEVQLSGNCFRNPLPPS